MAADWRDPGGLYDLRRDLTWGQLFLLPLVARNDDERRIVINSVGAHWEGNQVWLILAGGALFAAWPRVYAVAFSGLLCGDDSGAVLAVLPPAGL